MSVLIFVETAEGKAKPSSLEAVGYGAKVAEMLGTTATALVLGDAQELEKLGNYGASKVLHVADSRLNTGIIQAYSNVIAQAVEKENASVLVLAKSSLGDAVAARVAGRLKAGLASNVVELPNLSNGFVVKRSIYTGKAFANTMISTEKKILAIKKNIYSVTPSSNTASVEAFAPTLNDSDFVAKITNTEKATGTISLPEANIVVSGGRGLKGPENWGIVEELAKVLGAATGCSKPVSDLHWRPHHEHVGQTGVKVSPNLYIAIGISGAIQHLAGVNSSKCIVVINSDPEAPFFQAADYGIVGDAFQVVPKIIEAAKKM
ncbi:electron transfer flavoprotein subunit alpha/FixB family protein [Raineya orbicola]|jgi:electron transfer flavoprotein alpha subunit|uniref:Electron transfer flavoprotein alpha subunit n=1 Tax=Raineya orbicola TaxID=2016530 RepID=A0A2N3IH66_9BACT|nr:electron transfer flavoprotein subunit alpha/FixB family protein [Raineya orbicola]PKQ69631.1 Electron transfer flavoprotein alpha subunit [Raineya orbicola]